MQFNGQETQEEENHEKILGIGLKIGSKIGEEDSHYHGAGDDEEEQEIIQPEHAAMLASLGTPWQL